ncbi:MAG: glycosyltransferase [Hyphomonadaceae bacterium]
MISIVIPTLNAAATLPRTLAPLVDGVGHGLVKHVVVADGGSTDATLAIADAAGCDIVASVADEAKQLAAGAGAARGKWLFFLRPGSALAPGWVQEVERFVAAPKARQHAAAFSLGADDPSPDAQRKVFWARLRMRVLKQPGLEQGLLISRLLYDGLGGYADAPNAHAALIARIGRARLALLRTEALVAATSAIEEEYA